jgi:predicted metal-dependent hydrolase
MDARLREGIRLFNEGRFFESHEQLEDLYLHTSEEKDKPFLEGMIELSVAFRLFCEFGDLQGPVRMIHQALTRLENYQPTYLRIKVKDLIRSLEEWTHEAKTGNNEVSLVRKQIPKILTRSSFF